MTLMESSWNYYSIHTSVKGFIVQGFSHSIKQAIERSYFDHYQFSMVYSSPPEQCEYTA